MKSWKSAWVLTGSLLGPMKVLQVVLAAPRELRKAELERGLFARCGLEYLDAGTYDLGTYAVAPYHPDLDHGPMLATAGQHFSNKSDRLRSEAEGRSMLQC